MLCSLYGADHTDGVIVVVIIIIKLHTDPRWSHNQLCCRWEGILGSQILRCL